VLEDHPDGPFTHFLWVTRSSVHGPILSNDGASGNPGRFSNSKRGHNFTQAAGCPEAATAARLGG